MTQENFRRTWLITDNSIQLQYILLVLLGMGAVLVTAVGIVYYAGWNPLVERLANVYPQGRLLGILNTVYVKIAIGFGVLVPIAAVASVIVSHRVAGPLVRIRRYLELMAEGKVDIAPLELRRYDELKDIAELINDLIRGRKIRVSNSKELITQIRSTTEALKENLKSSSDEGVKEQLSKLHELLHDLDQTVVGQRG